MLKEFPVLGPGSVEAAQVAVAVRNQSQKMTVAAMEMADMKVWAHRS